MEAEAGTRKGSEKDSVPHGFPGGKTFLLLGGARSGKSALAVSLARQLGGKVIFLATARVIDPEMEERVSRHKEERPPHWKTLEWDGESFPGLPERVEVALLDSVTLLSSDLLTRAWEASPPEGGRTKAYMELVEEVARRALEVVEDLRRRSRYLVLVGDEVGMGLVPEDPLARAFRDLCGLVLQRIASFADRVWLVVAGLPMLLRDGGHCHAGQGLSSEDGDWAPGGRYLGKELGIMTDVEDPVRHRRGGRT